MSEADFKDMISKTMSQNPQTADLADRIDDMSIDDIGAVLQTKIEKMCIRDSFRVGIDRFPTGGSAVQISQHVGLSALVIGVDRFFKGVQKGGLTEKIVSSCMVQVTVGVDNL